MRVAVLAVAVMTQPDPLQKPSCSDTKSACPSWGERLFFADGTCRYPIAEFCPASCGDCERIHAARSCQSLALACSDDFCGTGKVDWKSYFEKLVRKFPGAKMVREGSPWAAEFPGFLTRAEAAELIRTAEKVGVQPEDALPPSVRDVDKVDCEGKCRLHPIVSEVYHRASELLELHPRNFESLEFLRYGRKQHYKAHMDDGGGITEDTFGSGPRVMTVFFYLNEVESGGETKFPHAKTGNASDVLLVTPEAGKVVIWANMKGNWWKPNKASMHQAVPVKKGIKWAANFWVHPMDYRSPEQHGHHCAREDLRTF
jgi:prolyl 4-hydroxylase